MCRQGEVSLEGRGGDGKGTLLYGSHGRQLAFGIYTALYSRHWAYYTLASIISRVWKKGRQGKEIWRWEIGLLCLCFAAVAIDEQLSVPPALKTSRFIEPL